MRPDDVPTELWSVLHRAVEQARAEAPADRVVAGAPGHDLPGRGRRGPPAGGNPHARGGAGVGCGKGAGRGSLIVTSHHVKVLEDGTRVYSNCVRYKPLCRQRAEVRRRKPDAPGRRVLERQVVAPARAAARRAAGLAADPAGHRRLRPRGQATEVQVRRVPQAGGPAVAQPVAP